MKQPAIYIMSNKEKVTLYIGVTSELVKRIYEHKSNIACDFTKRYNCKTLVYYEMHDTMEYATAATEESGLPRCVRNDGHKKRKDVAIHLSELR
jgi:predicted GIY-YIG superfamily endonuclease